MQFYLLFSNTSRQGLFVFPNTYLLFPVASLLYYTICGHYPYTLTLPNPSSIFNIKHYDIGKFYYIITFMNLPNFPLFFLPSVWYSLIECFIILSIISYYIILLKCFRPSQSKFILSLSFWGRAIFHKEIRRQFMCPLNYSLRRLTK